MPDPKMPKPPPDKARRISDTPLAGNIIRGRVLDYNPYHQSCTVLLDGKTAAPVPCFWLTGALSNFVGVRASTCPEPGTNVLVFWEPSMPYGLVLGKAPTVSVTGTAIPAMNTTGFETFRNYKTANQQKVDIEQKNINLPFANGEDLHPADLFSGDHVLSNEYGCALAILKIMASLKASDLAQIRMFAFDDLVQIISHNFQNFSSFGDFRITNDEGELTVSLEGTHRENEAMGSDTAGTAPFKKRTADADKAESSIGAASGTDADMTGLWRLKMFVGYLGDFFNVFITQPTDTFGKLSSTKPESGLFQFQVRTDGGCVIRSVKEVGLEKCSRIAVPKKIHEADDTNGDSPTRDYDPVLTREEFKWSDTAHPLIKALQLRDYSAYLNTVYGPARFKKHTKDWHVPEEEQTPVPDPNYDTDSTAVYKSVYATIRILYDGSIVILDASGSTIHMSGKSLKISAPEDVWIEAGRNINMLAGNDIIARARNSMDLTATEKDVRIKAQNNLEAVSLVGGILIESQGKVANSVLGDGGESTVIKGVVIKAKDATVSIYGRTMGLFSKSSIYLEAAVAVRTIATKIHNFCSTNWLARVGGGSSLVVQEGSVDAAVGQFRVKGIVEAALGGTQKIGSTTDGGVWSVNHNLKSPDNSAANQAEAQSNAGKLQETDQGVEQLEFTFRNDEDYRLPADFEMYQTPAQQALERDSLGEAWVEKAIKNKLPYPGDGAMTGDKFVTYEEQNVSLDADAIAKASSTVTTNVPDDGVKKKNINSSYIVRKKE